MSIITELLSGSVTDLFTPNYSDIEVIAKHIVGTEVLSESQIDLLDENDDGVIDLKDLNNMMGIVYNIEENE